MTQWIIAIACFVSVGGLLRAEWMESQRDRWVFKPVASVLFVALAIVGGALSSTFGVAILVGLVLCLAGDLLLIPAANPQSRAAFLAGMAAFAFGHIAYTTAFAINGLELRAANLLGMGAMTVLSALTIGAMWRRLGAFRVPVVLYAVIINAMVFAAIAAHDVGALADRPWINGGVGLAAAAIIFAISDVFVARDQFVNRAFFNRLLGLPLYYGAQLLFAASV